MFKYIQRLLGGLLVVVAVQAASPVMAQTTVNIVSPSVNDTLMQGKSVRVNVSVTVFDALLQDTEISGVRIFGNGSAVKGDDEANGVGVQDFLGDAILAIDEGLWKLDFTPAFNGAISLQAEATFEDGTTSLSSVFTYTVVESAPPSIEILAPASGSRYLPGTNLPVQVLAADPDGLIKKVEFLLNDNEVATSTSAPFRAEIQLPTIGAFRLKARAVDDSGVEIESDEIILEAGPVDESRPRVVMDFPLPLGDGDTVNDVSYASAMFLNATATDPDGSIETVNFYINGQKLGEAENRVGDVFSLFYDPNALGSYVISAEAIDDEGNISWSVPLLLDVGPLERQLPEAQMIAPFEESILGRVVGLFVEADGGLIPIDRVDFFANGVFLGSVDEPAVDNLYSFNWVPDEPGDYDLQARIVQIDPAGAVFDNWKITEPVPISISEPTGEEEATIEIVNPSDGDSSVVLRPILIQAEGLDPLGSIEEVRYYVNGRQQEIVDTRFPYSFTYEPQSPGLFQFVAEMMTDRGLRIQSDPVAVNIVVTDKPSGEIILPNGDNPTAGSDIRLLVEGNDPDGFIAQTELFVNGTVLRETFWRPENPGIYDLSALLTDNSGNEVLIERTVAVGEPVGIPPRVTLSVTGSGNVTPGSRVVVRANVFDDDPEDMRVSFLLNGEFIGEDVEAPYSIIVDPEVAAPNGAYSLTAVASDRDGNSRADNLAPLYVSDFSVDQPSVEILNLATGDEVTLGSRVPIRVDVSGGAAANLAHVVFYADGVEVGRLPGGEPTGKYTLDWIPDRLGWNEVSVATLLQTESFDHDDDIETPLIPVTPVNVSSPVSVFANEAIGVLPSISLDVMPNNANLAIGSKVMLYADAQDLGGEIEQVQFFIDGVNMGTDTEAPFTYILTTTRQGDFPINALATDSDGNVVTSTVVNLNVASRVVTRTPSISLTVPSSGQEGSLLSLRASTEGFVNPPEGIAFYANGESIGESGDVPYSLPWLVNLNGSVTFFSTATQTLSDGTRVTTVSQVEESLLSTNEVPVIEEFVASFPGESPEKPNPLGGEPITFTVGVQDSGPLRSVELLRDGEPIQESESAASPFEFTETPPGLGIYEYSVVVTDRGGLQAQSGVVSISVVEGEAPLVTVNAPEPNSEFRPGNPVQLRASAV
ncbi:MAG TPA: Ig-like domain-containing protein, partial [Oceanipulchritudo sp.]|nr:Ig-like domain-containing protein [Oceanipulchritudo sp.]